MGTNRQLEAIKANMPKYEDCRNEFFEHFETFKKLGPVNYAAWGQGTGVFQSPANEIVGVYLAGLALGRAQELSEQGQGQYWHAFEAFKLVEDALEASKPDPAPPAAQTKK